MAVQATLVLAALAPIAAVLVLMLGLRWSAARAGLVALVLAALLAQLVFGFGSARPAPGVLRAYGGVVAEGGFLALTILWILWPALALHRLQQDSGALDTLRNGLVRLTPQPALQALLVGWLLALFFEGAAGFGTPVALAAPILVGLGLAPVQAVVLALLGHAAGVSFGALGTPVTVQAGLTGLNPGDIAWRTALLHALLGGVLMMFFVRRLAAAGHRPGLGWSVLAAGGFLLPGLALASLLGPELATLGGALVGGAAFIGALHQRGGGSVAPGLARALAPYAALVVLVLLTRGLPPLARFLGDVTFEWRLFDAYQGRMQPLAHPGTLLMAALLIGAAVQRLPPRSLASALGRAARQLVPAIVALLAMLVLSRLMLHAGLISTLQQAAVQAVGAAWPWLAPAVGALGSFVTGSATASNVLFTTLQAQTAAALGLPAAAIVAAQGFGAAVGNIVCPHNIVAGAATVGLEGREGEVLRHTVLPCLLYLALGGAVVAALAGAERMLAT